MGELPLLLLVERLVRPRRPVQQSVRDRPQPVRVELRIGCGGLRELRCGFNRDRDGWQHRVPRQRERCGRNQTHRRPGQPGRSRADLAYPGHDRTPCPYRRRRGGSAWRPSRSRRSEEHTPELQSRFDLVCRLLLEKKYYFFYFLINLSNIKNKMNKQLKY